MEFLVDNHEDGKKIFEEAEILIHLDSILREAWIKGGSLGSNIELKKDNSILIKGNNAQLNNLRFEALEMGTLNLTFNFLTKEISEKKNYKYHVLQRDNLTGKTVGGETYEIRKNLKRVFYAEADNKNADKDTPITISAKSINEPAIYNWYDIDGNLIHEGVDFTTSIDIGKKYKLEVIALSDGFKDYTDVEVNLNPNSINSVYPNPTSNNLTIAYKINQGSSAYLSLNTLYDSNTNVSNNYIIDINENEIVLDLSTYPQGVYLISLITDGKISDLKTIIKQ